MRLFAALWPPAVVLEHLDLALDLVGSDLGAGSPDSSLRWAAAENRHVTVAFFGDLPQGGLEELSAGLREMTAVTTPFTLRLRGAGVFAHRTVWVGVAGELNRMSVLVQGAVEAGQAAGAWPDTRVRSRPHLTVGRTTTPVAARGRGRGGRPGRRGQDEPDAADLLVRALAVYEGPEWTVQDLLLVESRPGAGRGGGPLYTPVEAFPLVGQGAVGG